jgi:biotin transport system substrate-specific component
MTSRTSPVIALWPAAQGSTARQASLVVLGSLLLWASAKLQVPFWPVPMTMQTAVVLALAALYGRYLGLATVALYLAEGAVGLPVFVGTPERGLGLPYMLGPTGGYLVGFLVATALIGWGLERWHRPIAMLGLILAGAAAILACGVAWLSVLIGFDAAIANGLLPFLLSDLLKAGLATALVVALSRVPASS